MLTIVVANSILWLKSTCCFLHISLARKWREITRYLQAGDFYPNTVTWPGNELHYPIQTPAKTITTINRASAIYLSVPVSTPHLNLQDAHTQAVGFNGEEADARAVYSRIRGGWRRQEPASVEGADVELDCVWVHDGRVALVCCDALGSSSRRHHGRGIPKEGKQRVGRVGLVLRAWEKRE